MSTIPDKKLEELKELINTTIHELVFAVQLAEDNEIDSAQNAIMTPQGNLERVAHELVPFGD